jgi:lipopolysaccharide transport system ATP-binding protein
MPSPVIEVEGISMAYRMYAKPVDMLKEVLLGGVRHETFWAVRDIDLTVHEGDRVGIVGPNGAGKSTLLKIIAGNLQPTTGRVAVNGRVSSLLSMVPAWNEEETGIENIRFNLLLQGVPERRIPQLTDEIIDFTELGAFIFHPVKTYSTGMSARLSFAIATANDPDVLIIDEVLGTGDGYFAWKAFQRMQDFCARGRALLFVSHALSAVQQMCDRAIWIQNGTVRLQGQADYVLRQYELDFRRSEDELLRSKQASSAARKTVASPDEIADHEGIRFRIVPQNGGRFFAVHFVRAIQIHRAGFEPVLISLEAVDPSDSKIRASLDVFESEWGRLHERGGSVCRILSRATGKNLGGQFTLKVPTNIDQNKLQLDIAVEVTSTDNRERLAVEMLDMQDGHWRPLSLSGEKALKQGWRQLRFTVATERPAPERVIAVSERILEEGRREAEILGLEMVCNGETVHVVKERQPFEIHVKTRFHSPPKIADVGLKLTRADGVYIFWQSSGMSGANLENPEGEKVWRFVFNPNLLGSGDYFVNAHVTDGWRYPENYPYAEVFASVINGLTFRVAREMPEVDFGVMNQRVQVIVE